MQLYYFDDKLIEFLDLDFDKKYSCKFIYEKLKVRRSHFSKGKKVLWKIDKKFLNLIMDFNLIDTNKSFYELFYLNCADWRLHYKIGFTNTMIIKMIKSLIDNNNRENQILEYKDFGKKIDKLII